MSNDKIMPDHLARGAVAYIRQSSLQQVLNNVESKRRQYQLVERGRALGWNEVQVIDDDLGRSADGIMRPGFEKLLARICEGSVGIVLSLEASRLARTGREWHTLLEFCGIVNCLLADETRIYDPRQSDDRLVLGMQGTMSEMEISTLRLRAGEAKKQKARRGELLGRIAIGYVRTDDNRVEKDPNRRVQDAIGLVFDRFAELQTARQVLIWMKQEKILLPVVSYKSGKRSVEWIAPRYRTIHHVLMNPIYSGAYVYGRRRSVVTIKNGHKGGVCEEPAVDG
jgi:DNA invertase Pin-like site-specific DNA recombinase